MVLTYVAVVALMLLCGLAMARLMWIMDGRPPVRRRSKSDTEGSDQQDAAASDRRRQEIDALRAELDDLGGAGPRVPHDDN